MILVTLLFRGMLVSKLGATIYNKEMLKLLNHAKSFKCFCTCESVVPHTRCYHTNLLLLIHESSSIEYLIEFIVGTTYLEGSTSLLILHFGIDVYIPNNV